MPLYRVCIALLVLASCTTQEPGGPGLWKKACHQDLGPDAPADRVAIDLDREARCLSLLHELGEQDPSVSDRFARCSMKVRAKHGKQAETAAMEAEIKDCVTPQDRVKIEQALERARAERERFHRAFDRAE